MLKIGLDLGGTALKAFGLLALFAIAVIVSDLINDNYFQFTCVGSSPIAIGLNSLFFFVLVRSPRVLLFFLWNFAGACAGYFESAFLMVGIRRVCIFQC